MEEERGYGAETETAIGRDWCRRGGDNDDRFPGVEERSSEGCLPLPERALEEHLGVRDPTKHPVHGEACSVQLVVSNAEIDGEVRLGEPRRDGSVFVEMDLPIFDLPKRRPEVRDPLRRQYLQSEVGPRPEIVQSGEKTPSRQEEGRLVLIDFE